MQHLLTGKKRFAVFENEATKLIKIGELLIESRIQGSNGLKAKKLTVKLYGKGVIEKAEKRQGSENTTYYIRQSGQFIYSKLDFLNGAFGIIPESLDGYESTLDLPCFDFKGEVEPNFLLNYVCREEFYLRFWGSALGGRKARRISPSEFLSKKIRLPGLKEQQTITKVIASADKEIELHQKQLEAFKRQKKGLMQQLLTGRKRVQPDPEDW